MILSENFLKDTSGRIYNITPIVLITSYDANKNHVIEHSFSTDRLIIPVDGINVSTHPIIQKISNIKSGIDYDSKKLKVNRMRFTLYNYYDVNNKFFDVANVNDFTSLHNLNILIYYKTQSTTQIELPNPDVNTFADNSCSLIFVGTITRVSTTSDNISIQAEDSTIIQITDEQVPYKKIDYLSSSEKHKLPKYSEKDTVPMTYGDVDKAPCYPIHSSSAGADAYILHDRHSLYGPFITNPIPHNIKYHRYIRSYHNTSNTYNESSEIYGWNYIYKDDNETYLALDMASAYEHPNSLSGAGGGVSNSNAYHPSFNHDNSNKYAKTIYDLNKAKSVEGNTSAAYTYVFPEIRGSSAINSESSMDEVAWLKYSYPISAISTSTRSTYTQLADLKTTGSNIIGSDEEYCFSNNGFEREWYRHSDSINYYRKDEYKYLKAQGGSNQYASYSYNDEDDWKASRRLRKNRFTVLTLSESIRLINGHMDLRAIKDGSTDNPQAHGDWQHTCSIRILPIDKNLFKIFEDEGGDDDDIFDTLEETYGDEFDLTTTLDEANVDDLDDFYYWFKWYVQQHSAALPLGQYGGSKYHTSYNGIEMYPDWQGSQDEYVPWAGDPWIEPISPIVFNQHSTYGQDGYGNSEGIYGGKIYETPKNMLPFETDKILVIATPVGFLGNEEDALGDNRTITLGYQIGQCAFTSHERDSLFGDKLYASITGRAMSLYANPLQFFAPNFNITEYYTSSFGLGSAGGENAGFRLWYEGTDGARPSSYEDICDDIMKQVGEHSLAWEYYNNWKATYTNTSTPANGYYSLLEDLHDLLQPLDSFSYRPDPSLDDSALYLCPFIVNKILIPNWKRYLYYLFRMIVNRELDSDGNYLTSNYHSGAYDRNIQEDYEDGLSGWSKFREEFEFLFQQVFSYYYNTNDIENEMGAFARYNNTYSVNTDHSVDTSTINDFNDIMDNNLGLGYDLKDDMLERYSSYCNEDHLTFYNYSVELPQKHELYQVCDGALRIWKFNGNLEQLDIDSNIIYRPSDIVVHMLAYEVGYGITGTPFGYGSNYPMLDINKWDYDSIAKSRDAHKGWEMGFSIDSQENIQDLTEELLSETKSYIKFTQEGKLGFVTIDNRYTNDDIDLTLDVDDVVNYKITKSRIENVYAKSRTFYRYDNGHDKYLKKLGNREASDFLPLYTEDYYTLPDSARTKEFNLRYITHTQTAKEFQKHHLLNNCNQHNIIDLELPLSYIMEIGNIIHIPLIEDSKAFGFDYSVLNFVNGQYIYPLWLVTDIDVGLETLKIKAYQLHYLDAGDDHGYVEAGVEQVIYGVTQQYSSMNFTDGSPIPIKNYNPYATTNILPNGNDANDLAVSYLSFDSSETNVADLVDLVDMVLNDEDPSPGVLETFKYNSDGNIQSGYNRQTINIVDVVNVANVILGQ
tara:strand:- start:1732 stop:5988 length:4257 start_codon:yes stop_codon:yes gene_type:complete